MSESGSLATRVTRQPMKLLDQVRNAIRLSCCHRTVQAYAYSTEKTCVYWAKRFILNHDSDIGWRRKSANFSSTGR